MDLHFNKPQLNRLFPFHIIINKNLIVESIGRSLNKLINHTIDSDFTENYAILRPKIDKVTFESLHSLKDQLIIIQCKNENKTILRGQIEFFENSNKILFIGSVWYNSIEEVTENKLKISDFAISDTMIDMLHILKANEITNQDLKQILNKLNKQKLELKLANKEIHEIAQFPTENPDPLIRINFEGKLLRQNPAAEALKTFNYQNVNYTAEDFFKFIAPKIDFLNSRWLFEAKSGNNDYSFICRTNIENKYVNIYGRNNTEAKKNQEELKLLSIIIHETENAVIITDNKGKIEWVNKAFNKVTGFNFEDVKGKTPGKVLQGKDTDPQTVIYIREQLRLAQPFTTEIYNYKKSGKGYWLRISVQPLFDDDGNVERFFGIEEDITAEREAENKLNTQRKFYEEILDNIPADISVFDTQQKYLYVNPTGINNPLLRKSIIGKSEKDFLQLINLSVDVANYRSLKFKNVLETKKLVSWEEEIPVDNGKNINVVLNLFPVLNKENEVQMVIGYGVDITETKNIQLQIIESEKRYRDLIDNSLAIISTHNLEGKFLTINPMVKTTFGYEEDEIVGKNISEFLPDKEKANFISGYINIIKKEKKISGLFRLIHKNGHVVYTLFSNYLKEEPGKEPYVIGFSVDISERVKAQKELEIAKKTTERLAQTKQNFLANMSHEIRTPMNAIIGMTNQLCKTNLQDNQRFFLGHIKTAADNLLIIINDILDLSKFEAGKLSIETIGFEPKKLIKTAMQIISIKAQEKGLVITNSFFDQNISPVLIGDPYRLNQILLNILSNSVKFTEIGLVDIRCEVINDADAEQTIKTTIRDTGIGIEKEFINNLFSKFSQENKSVTRQYGGTGLGMNITYELIQLMNGNIKVESEKGKGTIVSFTINFKKGNKDNLPIKETAIIDAKLFEGKSILVTDDNEMNRVVASTILSGYGIIIEEAGNGKEAIDKIQKQHFDLVLMDVQMPEMDGIEATSYIRENISKDLPIIALTAYALKGDAEKFIAAGMDDYLSKPFEEKKLLNLISHYLFKSVKKPQDTSNNVIVDDIKKPELYNINTLKSLIGDDPEYINKLVNIFIKQVIDVLPQIKNAFEEDNFERVKNIAHGIKPSIDNMGISSLFDVVREIESTSWDDSSREELGKLITLLSDVLQAVLKQLENK